MQIKFGFSQREIQSAIKQIQAYKQSLPAKCNLLVQALVDRGVEIAKFNVQNLGAYYTGQLEASIGGYFSPSLGIGIIYAGSWYAAFVEFGTGIRGQEAQHPLAGIEGWVYDTNNHGEAGWTYFNEQDGKFHWTNGMPSRPFMYETAKELDKICLSIAKQVFK
jgi:hypothetical protein